MRVHPGQGADLIQGKHQDTLTVQTDHLTKPDQIQYISSMQKDHKIKVQTSTPVKHHIHENKYPEADDYYRGLVTCSGCTHTLQNIKWSKFLSV